MDHNAELDVPMDSLALYAHTHSMAGREPGRNWTSWFWKWLPEFITAKSAKLDLKCTKNFNKTIVNDFFDKWQAINNKYGGIPPKHIWNMDKKGIQLGGGWKNSGKKYFYLQSQQNWYCISSDNLELVTVIECVFAAGDSIPPSFILSGGPMLDLRRMPVGSISG